MKSKPDKVEPRMAPPHPLKRLRHATNRIGDIDKSFARGLHDDLHSSAIAEYHAFLDMVDQATADLRVLLDSDYVHPYADQ